MQNMTAAQILALPEYGVMVRSIVCKCGTRINIPFMSEMRAMHVGPDTIISVVDSEGVTWSPVETEFGWVRRRIG